MDINLLLKPFVDLIITLISLYGYVMFAWVILSLLITFDVLNRHNTFVYKLYEILYKFTEPLLRRVRRYMPDLGPVDLSPVVVLLLLHLVSNMLYTYFYGY